MEPMEPSRVGFQGLSFQGLNPVGALKEAYLAWGYGIADRGFRYSTTSRYKADNVEVLG
jgi:hypothetical protein